ncbi:NADH dehydrogenase [ubiquinone] 1 beta subcomplex subunit 3 [Arctopsyche grandis]|uniref:NADH dehydrogenase [ubiquinone] 1 beta subcomplex subunit 3 n=1 Tax=Arctopsyche grandis TaxID=121162 RepID=UPI00406D973D
MGGHSHAPYKVPDYTIYKVEDAPELMKIKKQLEKKGLSDPWLRNEVWRYSKEFPRPWANARIFIFRGFGVGLSLFGITLLYEQLTKSKDHDHEAHH